MFLSKLYKIDNSFKGFDIIEIPDYHPFLINYYFTAFEHLEEVFIGYFQDKLQDLFPNTLINFINQPLIFDNSNNNDSFVLEVFYINSSKSKIEFNAPLREFYLVNDNFDFLCAVSSDSSPAKYSNIFSNLNQSLISHNHSFANVIRQWNCIPNICFPNTNGRNEYSLFNDVRRSYYHRDKLDKYPSATGIGISGDFAQIIIFSLRGNLNIHRIENILQIPAYQYSDRIIKSESKRNSSTPMFSRGSILEFEGRNIFYLSGTASIRGEDTIGDDIVTQFDTTIDNINYLTSDNNIAKQINKKYSSIEPKYIKIYLKDRNHFELIKNKLDSTFSSCDYFIVEADICRSNLLFEIEGVYEMIY